MSDKILNFALSWQSAHNRDAALAEERRRVAAATRKQHTLSTVLRDLAGEHPIGFCRLDDGRLVDLNLADELTHALIVSASGGGKTRAAIGQILRHVQRALDALDPEREDQHLGIEIRVIDPKGETVRLLKAYLAELYLRLAPHQQRVLARSVHAVEWRRDRVTPFPSFAPAHVASTEYQCELKRDVMTRASRSAWTESLGFLLFQTLRLFAKLDWPLNFRVAERFYRDEAFRRSVLARLPDADLRHYFEAFPIARPTLDAFIRRLAVLFAYILIKLSLGLPTDELTRLGLPRDAAIVLVDAGPSRDLPPSTAAMLASWYLNDFLLEARSRDPQLALLALIEEAALLLGDGDQLTELFLDSLRVLRSARVALRLIVQSLHALPPTTVRNLEVNVQWILAFQSRREVGDLLYPHLLTDPRDTRTDAVRRREFLSDLETLQRQEAYFWRKGLPAIRVRSLDLPDPGATTGRTEPELQTIFDTQIAPHSTIPTARAESIIAAWENDILGSTAAAGAPKRTRGASSLADLLQQLDDEGDEA